MNKEQVDNKWAYNALLFQCWKSVMAMKLQEQEILREVVESSPYYSWFDNGQYSCDGWVPGDQLWCSYCGRDSQDLKFIRQQIHFHFNGHCREGFMVVSNIYTFGRSLEGLRYHVGVCLN